VAETDHPLPNGLKYVGWSVTVAAVAVYLIMLFVTLPHLAQLTRGEPVFDLRPLGYDFPTAEELVTRLGPDGGAYYENVQHRFGSIFPVLFCLALLYWLIMAARRWQGHGLPLGSPVLGAILATAVIASAAQLGENAAVSRMLLAGVKGLTPGMVDNANLFTLAKTFFTTISLLALVTLALGPWVAELSRRRKR